MFANKKLVRGLVTQARRAERATLEALRYGRVEQEPAFTDRLLGALEHMLNGRTIGGIRWTAKTFTDRGRHSQESRTGADFMEAFQVDLHDFHVAKGFLAQAKLVEPTDGFPSSEAVRLKEQCEKMLAHSPAAYVFLYSQQSGVMVVPAVEIVAARDCNPHELTAQPMAKFFESHFECFIGDHHIQGADRTSVDQLRERFDARTIFVLKGVGLQPPRDATHESTVPPRT